jgi:hypothetical protein
VNRRRAGLKIGLWGILRGFLRSLEKCINTLRIKAIHHFLVVLIEAEILTLKLAQQVAHRNAHIIDYLWPDCG